MMNRYYRSIFTLVIGFLTLVMNPAQADARGTRLHGGLTTHQVECESLCTEGTLTGGLAGLLEFTMNSMQETSNPDVVTYVGVNTITTSKGTLTGTDYGIWNLVTGEFIDFTVFSEGTGDYEGVHGTLLIIGGFDPVTGTGSSRYFASLH